MQLRAAPAGRTPARRSSGYGRSGSPRTRARDRPDRRLGSGTGHARHGGDRPSTTCSYVSGISQTSSTSSLITCDLVSQYPLFPNPVVGESILDRVINTSYHLLL